MVIRNTFFRFLVVFLLVSKLLRFGIWCLFAISKKTVFCFCDFFTFFQDKKTPVYWIFLKRVFNSPCFGLVFLQKGFFCIFAFLSLAFFSIWTKRSFLFWKTFFFMIMFNCILLKLRRRFCFSCFWRFFLFGLPFFSFAFIHLDKGVNLAFHGKSVILLIPWLIHRPPPSVLPFHHNHKHSVTSTCWGGLRDDGSNLSVYYLRYLVTSASVMSR